MPDGLDSTFECRLCCGTTYDPVLDLGTLPLANAFTNPGDVGDVPAGPVMLVMCGVCRLLQLRELVSRENLFSSYLWTSSSSNTAIRHAEWLTDHLLKRFPPSQYPFVVELASNDGLFLGHLASAGFHVLGVEPSNLAEDAMQAGIPTLRTFFDLETAQRIAADRGQADVVLARNVVGHVTDLRGFLAGVANLLRPGGVFVVESPYALALRHEFQYDTIFHEHVSYFSIRTLVDAFESQGLVASSVTFVAMNGGSYLCEAVRGDGRMDRSFESLLELERMLRLNEPQGWAGFAASVRLQREQLRELLHEIKEEGKSIAAYGAAAKTMTMFNYCGVSAELVSMIGDANPRKQGLICPGVRIPVVSPQALLARSPNCILIGPWNFADEIAHQLRSDGFDGELVAPLPLPRRLSALGAQ